MTDLDVAIVSYRSRDLLLSCLSSLRAHGPSGGACVIRVVDNASADGTSDAVQSKFPEVEVIALDENRGFSAATNVAIRQGSAPFVLVLNPDTEVRGKTLDTLLALLELRPEIGIAGCRLELRDGSFDHASKRAFPTVLGSLAHFSGIGRRVSHGPLAQYRAPGVSGGPIDAVNGAFMLIRRQALDEVGLFDEGYWMYMEDLDLCYRFRQAGWVTWYEPSVSALHVKHGTSPRRTLRLVIAFHAGMWRFYRTHYAPRRSRLVNGVVLCGIAMKLVLAAGRAGLGRCFQLRHGKVEGRAGC